ncbi:lipase maturation factor family protein [Horticoccus luteus]|uniref:Lipase maturation factor family protein n=1 Tax=Horticoccus luteus TaxID=2862869 RepID=A0A8F9XKL7_9BACT|nr:lipase maturation factor family protein [Horticoccus luteus]QYM78189.1 lipase maturation factor family protein [Horticoccus luteus]
MTAPRSSANSALKRGISGVGRELKAFAGLGDATFLWPRWFVLRAIGLVYVLVFSGVIVEREALIGPQGIAPLGEFFSFVKELHAGAAADLLHAPSLFWLNASPTMVTLLAWGGLVAAVALVLNLWPRMALFACWLLLLSFVATWQIFSGTQVDQLMLEAALLCIPFAPAGYRPGLGEASPPRPITVFMVRWFLFRVMFESGLVKVFVGDPHWRDFSALDVLYETSPFPTIIGYFDHHLPHAQHVIETGLTWLAEIVAPLVAIFGGRRGRWFAFVAWVGFQAGIQLTNNFGWLNTAAAAFGLVLLDDQMLASAAGWMRWSRLQHWIATRAALAQPVRPLPRWRRYGLRAALWTHFYVTIYVFALYLGLPETTRPFSLLAPLKTLFADFHSANPYTLYAGLLPERHAVEFEGSNDNGRTWRVYPFRYQPQRPDRMSGFIAPWYPRFEATLQVEATGDKLSPVFGVVARRLLEGSPAVLARFASNPFPDHPPTMMRLPVYRLRFTDWATYRATGNYWRKDYLGDYQPMLYVDDEGQVTVAASILDEVRVMAERGNAAAAQRLGLMYADGNGTAKNSRAAAKWLQLAAEHGETEARTRLGMMYTYGDGVAKNSVVAAQWFRLAAEQGDPVAEFFLGLSFAAGAGVPRDDAAAAAWYRQAAEQGHALAQYNLGLMYLQGQGLTADPAEAYVWFEVAALSGNQEGARGRDVAARALNAEQQAAAEKHAQAIVAKLKAAAVSPVK